VGDDSAVFPSQKRETEIKIKTENEQ
jgi:hypothetical protein